ncbi:MAG: hypothetical protein ACJ76S_10660 [Solirubrobacteraceae bacterium]
MSRSWLVAIAAVVTLAAVLVVALVRRRRRRGYVASVRIVDPPESTTVDERGAVRSLQAAELTMPRAALDAIWTPMHLERLARTYWRFLSRCTLGLVRVAYTDAERFVVLLCRPLVLLRFQAPEYEMDDCRGVVRWRIDRGLLVSRRGRGGNGYLQIDLRRSAANPQGYLTARVEVEVASFYPAIASGLSRWVYANTQSRIHVLVTHGFLRSLARLDLAESRVGRFARDTLPEGPAGVMPDPPPAERPPPPPAGPAISRGGLRR